jgi:hypothetical protein
MRKLHLIVFLVIVALIASVYIFIPQHLVVSETVYVDCPSSAAVRVLSNKENWKKWWPEQENNGKIVNDQQSISLAYNNIIYKFNAAHDLGVDLSIYEKNKVYKGRISCLSIPSDSSILLYQTSLSAGMNPVERVVQYIKAKTLKNNIKDVLHHLANYLNHEEHVYGYLIKRATIKDTVVLATKRIVDRYPDTEVIYSMINGLKNYISSQGGRTTNYPMLNVSKSDEGKFIVMVAFATDKDITPNKTYLRKRFQQNENKVLTLEVKGGPTKVLDAHHAMELYMSDHGFSTPVLPYDYLVTDRSITHDTTQWVTLLNYPVF